MTEHRKMISVIPGRSDIWRVSVLFGSLRYFWQLLFSRSSMPASSSSAWMIELDTLQALGGLDSYKTDVLPEARLAADLGSTYSCLINNPSLGVTYEKRWASQMETSRRLLYPMMGQSTLGGLLGMLALLVLNLPLIGVLSIFILDWGLVQMTSLWLMAAFMAVYAAYTGHLWQNMWWLGGILWPFVILQELVLFIQSWAGYVLKTITWKGRRIDVPKK